MELPLEKRLAHMPPIRPAALDAREARIVPILLLGIERAGSKILRKRSKISLHLSWTNGLHSPN